MAREHLQVRVGADTSSLSAGLNRATRSVDRWAGGLKSRLVGMFGASALGYGALRMVRSTVEYASKMTDLAARTGLAVEEMQRLDRVARVTGISLERLYKAFQNIERRRFEALQDPSGKQAAAFGMFGITADMLRTMSGQDLLKTVGGTPNIGKMQGPLFKLFEETGPDLIEALEVYASDSLQNMSVISAETAQQLDAVSDSFESLKQELLVGLAPALSVVLGVMRDTSKAMNYSGGWIKGFAALAAGPAFGFSHFFQKGGAYQESLEESVRAAFEKAGSLGKPPGDPFVPTEITKPELKKRPNIYSDSLLAVGNFLGASGQSTVLNIYQKQLRKVEAIERNTTRMLEKMENGGLFV